MSLIPIFEVYLEQSRNQNACIPLHNCKYVVTGSWPVKTQRKQEWELYKSYNIEIVVGSDRGEVMSNRQGFRPLTVNARTQDTIKCIYGLGILDDTI